MIVTMLIAVMILALAILCVMAWLHGNAIGYKAGVGDESRRYFQTPRIKTFMRGNDMQCYETEILGEKYGMGITLTGEKEIDERNMKHALDRVKRTIAEGWFPDDKLKQY